MADEGIPKEFDCTKPDGRLNQQFWKQRSKHGRYKKYTPETLWLSAVDWFQWMEDNPLEASEIVKFKGGATIAKVPKLRAMTLDAFTLYLDISISTWHNYAKQSDYEEVCERINKIIYTQKLTGAAADLLNSNIISRELGLHDGLKVGGIDGAPLKIDGINWVGEDEN